MTNTMRRWCACDLCILCQCQQLIELITHLACFGLPGYFETMKMYRAFDKLNHYGLFIKLMGRSVPFSLLSVIEHWIVFTVFVSVIFFGIFTVDCGVRQGGVLSPLLFAIYVDDIVRIINMSDLGCRLCMTHIAVILYADDILLLAPSVDSLQKLVLQNWSCHN